MNSPTFAGKKRLVRYIDEGQRLGGNRPAVAAFLPEESSDNPSDDHLSVNSLEVETMKEIATYHRWRAQDNRGSVALCVHKILDYSEAGKKFGAKVSYDRRASQWQFPDVGGKQEAAYRHRPVPKHANPLGSPSHCGVEFTRIFKEHEAARFARWLASRGKFHVE